MATFTFKNPDRARSVVLVGVDFSDHSPAHGFTSASLHAVETAEALARSVARSELHLVHALTVSPVPIDADELLPWRDHALDRQWIRARDAVNHLAASATSGIDRVTGHVRVGARATTIVELALDIGADLVVMGAPRHRAGVSRLVLGSVAEKVARSAPCPVLIAHPKTIPLWEQIEPPCPECIRVQRATSGSQLWCDRHSEHRPRPHTYHEGPTGFGMGAMTFRFG